MRQRGGPEGLGPEAASESRCVDRVVEVRVADEDPGHLPRRPEVAGDQRFVRQGPSPQEQRPKRHPRHVRIDENRDALICEPIARDAEPRDLKSAGQVERDALELA